MAMRTRPPQHGPSSAPSARSRMTTWSPWTASACASAIARHSSAPPPMVPRKAPSSRTTMRAPASRGTEPLAETTVTAAHAWAAAALAEIRSERPLAHDHLVAVAGKRLRIHHRPPFERAAADVAAEGAVITHHHAGSRLARYLAARRDHRHGGTAMARGQHLPN